MLQITIIKGIDGGYVIQTIAGMYVARDFDHLINLLIPLLESVR